MAGYGIYISISLFKEIVKFYAKKEIRAISCFEEKKGKNDFLKKYAEKKTLFSLFFSHLLTLLLKIDIITLLCSKKT